MGYTWHFDTKYISKSQKIKQNWTRPENFDIYFSTIFDRQWQKFNTGGRTGH